NMPDYPADRMGTYYCVVTDDAGNEVKSDYAEVNFGLFIAYQPQNANLYKEGSVAMYCKAAGGVLNENGGYTYTLVGPTEQDRITDEEGWYCLDQPGEYYFIVEDAVGSVTSQKATVYSALPVWVECVSEPVLYTSGPEKVTVEMEFGGGVPPYTCDWLMTGSNEKLKTFVTYDTHDEMSFSDNGTYWLRVTDSMGDFTSANCRVINEQLKIARQPESGMLAVDGTGYDVSMEMAEGQAPFWYSLYRDDEIVAEHEDGAAISEGISCAGRYYYHVEDAVGCWADSDVFIVEDYQFYIHSYTGYTEIPEPYGGAELEITIFGGEAPYTCRWEWESFDDHIARSWTVIQQEETRVFTEWVEQPGFYWFIITDAYGNQAYTERIIVKYTGDAPFITTQPSDVYWPYVKGQEYYPTVLYCEAINSARNDYYLKYQWWYYWENRWNAGSTESRFELPKVTNTVLAYCTVTDTRTGESTVSRVATVQVGLSVSLNMSKGDHDSRYSRLHFFIEGGVGPYTYSVYTIRQNGCDENGEPIFVETLYSCCTMFDFTGGAYYTDVENIWYGLVQYAEGKWDQVLHVAKYRVEVIDALGQTAEAGWIDASVLYDVFRYIDK
ncbi:MAG: hypothetical protein J6T47_10820, partial [Lachnospiraceae bacterium]|nr:hypothetical protein [Lachnospiraceae bacterium]